MVKKAVHNLLRHRHFWRDIDFTELSEIYISMLFRSLSISVVSIFVPFYMITLGFDISAVLQLMMWYFVARFAFFDMFSGWLTSRIGPKHTIIASYGLLTISTLQFLSLSHFDWPIWLLGVVYGASTSLFSIPFHVDFSSIQHKEHGGKELAYVHMLMKIGAIFGPLIGGFVGGIFGGQYIFFVAIILLFVGGWPLLRTAEPVKIGTSMDFITLRLSKMKRDTAPFMMSGVEHTVTMYLWPIYLGIFVIVGASAYEKLGILASLSVIVSIAAVYTIGKMIDSHQGGLLLKAGTILNAALHLIRPHTASYPAALAVNAANEGVTAMYQLPYVKGMYDAGDSRGENRTAYFTYMEWTASYSRLMFWVLMVGLAEFMSSKSFIALGFYIGAVASLLIMVQSFPALKAKDR